MMMIPLSRRFHSLHGFFRRILVAPLKGSNYLVFSVFLDVDKEIGSCVALKISEMSVISGQKCQSCLLLCLFPVIMCDIMINYK